jgi:dipeptidase E
MKFLLTSAGITNDSIRGALIDLLGKPFAEASALCVPTAVYALPDGPNDAWLTVRAFDLGWRSYGVLELTALPTLPEEHWLPALEATDVLLVGGGNTGYLSYWLHQSGLAARLPALLQSTVYVGVSAGSMMLTHSLNVHRPTLEATGVFYDDEYDEAAPQGAGSDRTLGLLPFVIRPHLNADYFPKITPVRVAEMAARQTVPLYAFDDQSALKVVDGEVEVVSEGEWKRFEPSQA